MDLSQHELARRSKISRNYISMIERGVVSNISVEILVSLAEAMHVDPAYWFGVLQDKED